MRYFAYYRDAQKFTPEGHLAACCGAYQADTIEEFNETTGGMVLFTDTVEHLFEVPSNYQKEVVKYKDWVFHMKFLMEILDGESFNSNEKKAENSYKLKPKVDYPFNSLFLEDYFCEPTYNGHHVAGKSLTLSILTKEQSQDGYRTKLEKLEKNSHKVYESPWFYNHNDGPHSAARLQLFIYDRNP